MSDQERGHLKGQIFTKAYKRANRALDSGFYIETIVICDSLITDRLRLILMSNEESMTGKGTTGSIANFLLGKKVPCFDDNLWADLLEWSRMRNKQAHEMGKISGTELVKWRTRISEAKGVAQAGFALVNRVSKEVRHHRL